MILLALSACDRTDETTNDMCKFEMTDSISAEWPAEAQDAFERAIAYDVDVMQQDPASIRPELRGKQPDRKVARRFYQEAADLGHVPAMGVLATYYLQGFGRSDESFEPEPRKAFVLVSQLAQRGEARGYQGMAAMLHDGFSGTAADPQKAARCMEEAAIRAAPDYLEPAFYLAEMDLNLRPGLEQTAAKPTARIQRGIALMEDQALKGNLEGFLALGHYHTWNDPRPKAAEYYARAAAQAGSANARIQLSTGYKGDYFGAPNETMSECVKAIPRDQANTIETACPLPDGPITRSEAGISNAPAEPLNLATYLNEFRGLHPDL